MYTKEDEVKEAHGVLDELGIRRDYNEGEATLATRIREIAPQSAEDTKSRLKLEDYAEGLEERLRELIIYGQALEKNWSKESPLIIVTIGQRIVELAQGEI